jgi:hypothetical protein
MLTVYNLPPPTQAKAICSLASGKQERSKLPALTRCLEHGCVVRSFAEFSIGITPLSARPSAHLYTIHNNTTEGKGSS